MFPSALLHPTIVFAFVISAAALPLPSDSETASSAKDPWSKEAILGLVAVLVAITLFCIGLSTKRLRRWTAGLFKCLRPRHANHRLATDGRSELSILLLRRRTEEWLEFNEWRRFVEARGEDYQLRDHQNDHAVGTTRH